MNYIQLRIVSGIALGGILYVTGAFSALAAFLSITGTDTCGTTGHGYNTASGYGYGTFDTNCQQPNTDG